MFSFTLQLRYHNSRIYVMIFVDFVVTKFYHFLKHNQERSTKKQHGAGILDQFDALVNDISIGLPAEIEARRKQYEYFRSNLLTLMKYE